MHLYTGGKLRKDKHDYYDGEAYLCPPREKPPGMQTTFGLIQIYFGAQRDSRSIAINKASDEMSEFQASRRDSFCRQLGFTRAVVDSVYTLSAMNGTYHFDHCKKYVSYLFCSENKRNRSLMPDSYSKRLKRGMNGISKQENKATILYAGFLKLLLG